MLLWRHPPLFSQFEHLFSKIGATRAAKKVGDGARVTFRLVDVTLAALIGCTLFGIARTRSKVRSLPGMCRVMNVSPCVSFPPLSLVQARRTSVARSAAP